MVATAVVGGGRVLWRSSEQRCLRTSAIARMCIYMRSWGEDGDILMLRLVPSHQSFYGHCANNLPGSLDLRIRLQRTALIVA